MFDGSSVLGVDIEQSVGLGGINASDDVMVIKHLLNGVPAERGGAFGSLTETDAAKTGDDFDRMVDAIKIFQDFHFRALFQPDGRVDPNRKTIKKLHEEFFKNVPKPPNNQERGVLKPREILGGFSDAKLSRITLGDWTDFESEFPLCQMVPLGKTRTILVLTNAGSGIIGFHNSHPHVAKISVSQDTLNMTSITILGTKRGESMLTITAGGVLIDKVRIIVRRRLSQTVHLHFLGDSSQGKGAIQGGGTALIEHLNKIYGPQANLFFSLGVERTIAQINGRAIDFARKITVDPSSSFPIDSKKQWFKGDEFDASCINDGFDINVFACEKLDVVSDPTAIGVAFPIGHKRAWFEAKALKQLGQGTTLVGHEVGHSIGLRHIIPPINALMNPKIIPNGVFIPSETLVDLGMN